jgi:hypothetical protein
MGPAQEPERLTAEEVDKELAVVEAYLERDLAGATEDRKPGESTIANFAATKVVRALGGLPEDDPARLRAIALARKHAAIPRDAAAEGLRGRRVMGSVEAHQLHARLYFAWGALREVGVLRDGLRLEELVALLGPPSKIGPEVAEWHYNSRMHVDPCLYYWRTGGGGKKGRVEITRR